METSFRVIVHSETTERNKALKGKPLSALQPLLEADLENRFSNVRKLFGLKRRDLTVTYEESLAILATEFFEYRVSLAWQETDTEIQWRREVALAPQQGWALLSEAKFQEAFGDVFEAVICEFSSALNVVELIDRLEEKDDPTLSLDYDSRCEWLEVSKKGSAGKIRLQDSRVYLHAGPGASPLALACLFEDLQQYLSMKRKIHC